MVKKARNFIVFDAKTARTHPARVYPIISSGTTRAGKSPCHRFLASSSFFF